MSVKRMADPRKGNPVALGPRFRAQDHQPLGLRFEQGADLDGEEGKVNTVWLSTVRSYILQVSLRSFLWSNG